MNFHLEISLGLDSLLRRINATPWERWSKNWQPDVSGQQERQSVNITKVEEVICSQENASSTHKRPQKIEQIKGIARSSVVMLTDFLADHRPIAESLH